MSSNFEIAIQLLVVGMLTVFTILFLVVFIGNSIIRLVNRFFPEVESLAVAHAVKSSAIDPNKMAAITAAVQSVTNGKGRIVKVEKK